MKNVFSPVPAVGLLSRWHALLCAMLLGLGACSTTPPDGITAVTPFDVNRYAGKWYEIARMDHSFERGLSEVSATYRLQPDGSVEVINRGFDSGRKDWKQAVGKALFTGDPNRASLKVSFFGPFYGSYVIFELDHEGYQYSLVSGPDKSYLWILARRPEIDDDLKKVLIGKAAALGFDTNKLIFVKHQ